MDRRSSTSLWRDYGVPMQDPNAYSLQYGKDSTRDPRKGLLKSKGKKKENRDLFKDTTGLLNQKMQMGGVITDTTTKTPAVDDWTKAAQQDVENFKQKLPTLDEDKNRARLYAYKTQLDSLLSSKNPTAWKQLNTTNKFNETTPIADRISKATSYVNDKTYPYALSEQEMRQSLGNNYDDFNTLRATYDKKYGFGAQGMAEKNMPVQNTAYGLRNSWGIVPMVHSSVMTASPVPNTKPIPRTEVVARTSYDPVKKAYDYQYDAPKFYAMKQEGGLLRKVDTTTTTPVDISKYIYNKDQFKDPIIQGMDKYKQYKTLQYRTGTDRYENIQKQLNPVTTLSNLDRFIIKDTENNKPGIRNNAKVYKQVVSDLAKAAAKEQVPLMDALTNSLRESGLGSATGVWKDNNNANRVVYVPQQIMQSWSSNNQKGAPMSYEEFIINKNLVSPDKVIKNKFGYSVDPQSIDQDEYMSHGDKYNEYLDSFKPDEDFKQPFIKDIRFLKTHTGQAYNSGEKDRLAKIEKERQVIVNNPNLYNYADSVYKANIPTQYMTGGIIRKKSKQ